MSRACWSKPYHGVQHLFGVKRGCQVTVCAYSSTAKCTIFGVGSREHFFTGAMTTDHSTPEEARAYAEERAQALGILHN